MQWGDMFHTAAEQHVYYTELVFKKSQERLKCEFKLPDLSKYMLNICNEQVLEAWSQE